MKLTAAQQEERDTFRLVLVANWETTYATLFGECDACRNLALAAIELAGWELSDFLLVRPLFCDGD